MGEEILRSRPSSGLGPHITTPLWKNVAVHHSKNCALMSQMGPEAVILETSAVSPLYLDERTSIDAMGMSAYCHKPTYAVQHTNWLFDHLVGAGEHGCWSVEAERLRCLEI